jgi:hypothetical protein
MNPNYCTHCGEEVDFPRETICANCGTAIVPKPDKSEESMMDKIFGEMPPEELEDYLLPE